MPRQMKALRFDHYGPPSTLRIEPLELPDPKPGESLIEVRAAGINPSDVKAVAGQFHSPLPRTPGRDYAGIVVAGDGTGREVWGSGPGFGVARDGAHAELVLLPSAWLADKPQRLSMSQAASIGVPYVVAWEGLVNAGELKAGETLLVTGVAGAVGRAATQIAHWRGARVIGTDNADRASEADLLINVSRDDLPAAVRAATGGAGVDMVFDAVGGPLFEQALNSLRPLGRHVVIASTGPRRVSLDLIDFYHQRARLIGVDSLKLDGPQIAAIMNTLRSGFESGQLRPYEIKQSPLDQAVRAYTAVEQGTGPVKQVLVMQS
jgi:NADPH:quinone reductase